jgi:hypothetical protein
MVAIYTVGYCDVPVRIELWGAEPPADPDDWDHVVEATLELGSGQLALAGVEGPAELEPLGVEPGTYRLRSSASGIGGATETDGGDYYRIQLWLARAADPVVLRWWPPWDPAAAAARPTSGGRVLLGAGAYEARVRMTWLASRSVAHLFRDADGVLWEHSTLRDAAGTPQLEELGEEEAERRYGPADGWASGSLRMPSLGDMVRNISQTLRHQQDWRPEPDPTDPLVEDGRRVYVGNTAANRVSAMTWVGSVAGDNLHVDAEGSYWELPGRAGHREKLRLVELTREEAEAKYGELG